MFFKALCAAVHNPELAGSALNPHWLHKTAALLFPITRLNINMLAPQTLRAMIGVPGALYLCAAFLTGEILLHPLKAHTTSLLEEYGHTPAA